MGLEGSAVLRGGREGKGDKWGGKGGGVKGIQTVEKYSSIKGRKGRGISGEGKGVGWKECRRWRSIVGVGGIGSIKRREGREGG